jgi:EmrB/QacA subfamily drug resistance transporter
VEGTADKAINWVALGALGIATVTIANDFSAINVALPTMERDFNTNINTIQWVVNAYALTFGVMIVTGGRLADMFGRRNAFFLGAAIFAVMSALGGAAQTETWLIAARVLMGIGGALMWPAILGMTFAILPEDRAGLAGGIILGAAGLGNAMGPLIGGVLTDALSWRWIFFLNVPIAIFAVAVTYKLVKVKEPDGGERRIDYLGISALSIGLVSLLIALDQVDDWGWGDPRVIGLLVLAAVLVSAFVPIERRAGSRALVPRAVMSNESFRASCLAILFMSATFFASLLYLPQFMQTQLGYSPLEAGVGILPFLGTFAVVSFVAGPLYERVGAKVLAVLGAACITIAPFLFSQIDGSSGYDSRGRQLLPDRDHGGSHLGRRLADQPRRRHRLHVPDRRRLDRARADDDGLLGLGAGGGLQAGRRPLADRLPDRALLRRRQAVRADGPGRRLELVGAQFWERAFSPGPPSRVSTPGPPCSWSSPLPPTNSSAPSPPLRTSSPSRPTSRSTPSPPNSLSAPEPPTRTSLPRPPRIVTGIGIWCETTTLSSPPSALTSKALTWTAWQIS